MGRAAQNGGGVTRRGKEVPNRSWGRGRKSLRPPRCAPRRREPSFLFPFSSISSSSRNCGARPPRCPGPGPAPHRHSRLMTRSHPGQAMVRRARCAGDRPGRRRASWHCPADSFSRQVPVPPPAPDSSGEPRGRRICSLNSLRRPQTPRRSLARPRALTEKTPWGQYCLNEAGGGTGG